MKLPILSTFVVCAAFASAQEPAAPVAPDAAESAPALPQAGSDEARQMVLGAVDKMLAYGRGRFATTETQDSAMLRQAGLPFGANDTEIDGGWHHHTWWGEYDGRKFVAANGRMVADVDGGWRLRRSRLSGGVELPFALDPTLLFAALKQIPKRASNVVHVEAGKDRGQQVAILTMKLEADDAVEFADVGAVPDVGGGFSGVVMLGGLGGAIERPRPELETYLAFFVDPQNGDLLRFAARTYQTDAMMGNIQIAVGGAGAGGADEQEEEEEAVEDGPVEWRRGFPRIKPAKDQSVMTYRVDFEELGLAEMPVLDDATKALLRVR